jgi:hypothetical protein
VVGDPKLELARVLELDAVDLFTARERSRLIHKTLDIDAAGDEVEVAARAVLQRKLALHYRIGHGHVVDRTWQVSPQLDAVITDNSVPVLFRSLPGTEYFPYEAVYAIGEIKSSYYARKLPIEVFVKGLSKTLALHREQTPRHYVGNGLSLVDMKVDDERPYKNPLFSFMLFVSANDLDTSQIAHLYSSTANDSLPNVVCFLDRCVIVNVRTSSGSLHLNHIPAFGKPGSDWGILTPASGAAVPAFCFGMLYFLLAHHLSTCKLMPIKYEEYLLKAVGDVTVTAL